MNIHSLNRQEVLDVLKTKETWPRKDVTVMVSTMKGLKLEPTSIKIGDVHTTNGLGHPAVVFKITGDVAYSVLLTTDDTVLSIIKKCDSRFFPNSYLTGTIIATSKENVLSTLFKIYDNNKEIRKLKKYLSDSYKHILK